MLLLYNLIAARRLDQQLLLTTTQVMKKVIHLAHPLYEGNPESDLARYQFIVPPIRQPQNCLSAVPVTVSYTGEMQLALLLL